MPSPLDFPPDTIPQQRRFLIAAGTSDYKRLPEDAQLPSVKHDLEQIRTLFCDTLRYENALPSLNINPESRVFREALRDWVQKKDRSESDVLVIYYSGHGDIEQDRHYLLTSDSNPDDLLDSAIPTEDLARRIASSRLRLVLILIDTCYAGQGSGDIAKVVSNIKGLFSAENVGFFVIAAARPKEEARQGVFAEALVSVLNDERLAGALQEFLLPTSISTAINRYFRDRKLSQLTMVHESYVGYEDPPFFRNPRFQAAIPVGVDLQTQKRLSSMAPTDVLSHWGPRARGVELGSQAGWYFTGRTRILRELVGWLKSPAADAKPQVVTGAPGVGKSAVLARLATIADPEFRREAPLADFDPDTIPPEGCIDIAIHAKGKTIAEVVRTISTMAGVATDDPANLVRDLAVRSQPLTIVIDALDEAKDSNAIADKVIEPIAPLPTVRLLIGTRKALLPRLGTHVEIKYLDGEYNEPSDIRDYVKLRLVARDEPEIATPYRNKPELVNKVADAVAAKAGTVFLLARLICENLIQAKEVVDPDSQAWRAQLPDSVAAAFGEYLRRFGTDEYRVRDLLLPLAYAEGEGLPWDVLWAPLASALADRAYTDRDVAWLRDKAGAYIIEALQAGQSVYRLYHQALADYFHDDELDQERQRRVARALVASVPEREGSKVWQEGHTYVLQHLSTHAARGGMLPELVRDPLYLLTADPVGLLPAINRAISSLPAEIIRVYKQTVHLLHGTSLQERASYLELNARKQRAFEMADAIACLSLYRKWVPKWAVWEQTYTVLKGHKGAVTSVALGLIGSQEVIVSGSSDQTVRVWEAAIGKELQALKGHKGAVTSVALGLIGGQEVIVSGSSDQTVRVWEAAIGKELQALKGHKGPVTSVALGLAGSQEVIVSAGDDGTIRVWEALTGKQLLELKGHKDKVTSVALGLVGERHVIVSGGLREVPVWEATTGEELHTFPGGECVRSVALGQIGNREVIVSVGDYDSVHVWEASTGKELQLLERNTSSRSSVALGQIGNREVIVAASAGWVSVWDASTGEQLQGPWGEEGEITSVALGLVGGREVIVFGSSDQAVRVWEAAIGEEQRTANSSYYYSSFVASVTSVALGQVRRRDVVVSGGSREVRIWQAATGEEVHRFFLEEDSVDSLALGQIGDREVIVSANDEETVRIWEASTGKQLQVLKCHKSGLISVALEFTWRLIGGRIPGRPIKWVPSDPTTHSGLRTVALGLVGGRKVIVSATDDMTVRIWEASTGKQLQVLKCHKSGLISIALELASRLTGAHLRCNTGGWVTSVVLGQIGGRDVIVSGGIDTTVRIWEASTGKQLQVLRGHEDSVNSVALGLVGGREVIVSGSKDMTIRIWEASTGRELQALKSHEGEVTSVALGQFEGREVIVSGGYDMTVRVWEAQANEPWASIILGSQVRRLALKGAYIVASTSQGIAVLALTEKSY